MKTPCLRFAFTLIELIVSLLIVSVLSTIVLVGLNSARESARDIACVSNQRQIGVAIAGYETAFRVLPINVVEEDSGGMAIPRELHSAHARLLPFVDQANMFERIKFGEAVHYYDEKSLDAPPVFRCPSESKSTRRSFNYCYSVGTKSRAISIVEAHKSEMEGAFGTTFRQISTGLNGLSNLIYISERSVGSNAGLANNWLNRELVSFEQGNWKRDWYSIFFLGEPQSGFFTPNQWTQICARTLERKPNWETSTGALWLYGRDAYFNQIMTPNSQIPDCGMNVLLIDGTRSARSEHQGHVNVLFGDGSVRSIDDAIELAVWRDLGAVNKRLTPTVDP